jgi:REP element-mobilizing transposase RayT
MANRSPQFSFLAPQPRAYGGELLKTRKGRSTPRPLSTRETMHLVLRSSRARGSWSMQRPEHRSSVANLVRRFSLRHGVRVLSFANVGNHLHFHIQITSRRTYVPFIRALTSSIAMAITGVSRWSRLDSRTRLKFWDYRPFTRVLAQGLRSFLKLRDYVAMNRLEGAGHSREEARWMKILHRETG